jgi:hypothetical protein
MSLHPLKLFVGAETLHELATHQAQRLEERRRNGLMASSVMGMLLS